MVYRGGEGKEQQEGGRGKEVDGGSAGLRLKGGLDDGGDDLLLVQEPQRRRPGCSCSSFPSCLIVCFGGVVGGGAVWKVVCWLGTSMKK